MSKSNDSENAILALLFNNTGIANWGDSAGIQPSASAGSFYVSLYTADPGETGSASTNECSYTSYARVAVARSSSGFTVSGNAVTNTSDVTFPAATGGSETATHFAVVNTASGAGQIIYSGALTSSLAISSGITPTFAAGQLQITED